MICYADEKLGAYSECGETLKLFVDETILNGSVHEGPLCTSFCSCSAAARRGAGPGFSRVAEGSFLATCR